MLSFLSFEFSACVTCWRVSPLTSEGLLQTVVASGLRLPERWSLPPLLGFTVPSESTNHLGGSRELLCSGAVQQRASLCSLWLLKATVSLSCTSYLELSWQTTFLCLPTVSRGAKSTVCSLTPDSTDGCGLKLRVYELCSFCYCLQHFLSCLRVSYFLRKGQFYVQINVWLVWLLGWEE